MLLNDAKYLRQTDGDVCMQGAVESHVLLSQYSRRAPHKARQPSSGSVSWLFVCIKKTQRTVSSLALLQKIPPRPLLSSCARQGVFTGD